MPTSNSRLYSPPLWRGWGRVCTPYYENTLHPSVRRAGREILVSSRLGPRMESAMNMSEREHDNMSASHWRCGNVNGMGTCTFSLACKERICAGYQCLSVGEQAGMRRSTLNVNVKRSSLNIIPLSFIKLPPSFSCIFYFNSIPLYAKISKETFLLCTG